MTAASFTDGFLDVLFPRDRVGDLFALSVTNRWAQWKAMRDYYSDLEPGDISHQDRANDYSPEAEE